MRFAASSKLWGNGKEVAVAENIGTLLTRKGLITPKQLDEAVAAQKIYGGRLGTCLVELDYLDLETLGAVLGEQLRVPVATLAALQGVSKHTLLLISADLADTLNFVPLSVEGRRLKVAMLSPQDLEACETLGFRTGLRIVPCLVPELRLLAFLERHYGVTRNARYIRLAPEKVVEPRRAAPGPSAPAPDAGARKMFGTLKAGQLLGEDAEGQPASAPVAPPPRLLAQPLRAVSGSIPAGPARRKV